MKEDILTEEMEVQDTENTSETVTDTTDFFDDESVETTDSVTSEKVEMLETELIPNELDDEEDKQVEVAYLLGKTETGLKKEFYIYQIKELMKHVGCVANGTNLTKKQLESDIDFLVKYGVDEFLVSPICVNEIQDIKERLNPDIRFGVMLDAPLGEQPHKSRLQAVKEMNKTAIDYTDIVFPKNAVSLNKVSEYKWKTAKLSKVSKKPFGVMFDIKLEKKEFTDILKVLESTKSSQIILNIIGMPKKEVKELVTLAVSLKKKKKISVYSNVSEVSELSALLELKVDKVYTPNAIEIGNKLSEKFGITEKDNVK